MKSLTACWNTWRVRGVRATVGVIAAAVACGGLAACEGGTTPDEDSVHRGTGASESPRGVGGTEGRGTPGSGQQGRQPGDINRPNGNVPDDDPAAPMPPGGRPGDINRPNGNQPRGTSPQQPRNP